MIVNINAINFTSIEKYFPSNIKYRKLNAKTNTYEALLKTLKLGYLLPVCSLQHRQENYCTNNIPSGRSTYNVLYRIYLKGFVFDFGKI